VEERRRDNRRKRLLFCTPLVLTFLIASMAAALSILNSSWQRLRRFVLNVLPKLSSSYRWGGGKDGRERRTEGDDGGRGREMRVR
jgi:hypothetical protein